MFYKKYVFGDTALHFCETQIGGEKGVGLTVLPLSRPFDQEKFPPDPLVQVAFSTDRSLMDYSRGVSMKNRESALMQVEEQTQTGDQILTRITDGKGNRYLHTLSYDRKTGVFCANVEYKNETGKPQTIEFLASACISLVPQAGAGRLSLYRMTSAWSRECKLKKDGFWELGLEESWARHGLKSEKWGSIGSMPNRGYYPFAAIEDQDGTIWGMTVEAPYSWQMDLSLEGEGVSLAAGLADFEAGHWRKEIKNGEYFKTHNAYFTVKERGGVNAVCNAFLHEADGRLRVPESEEELPVLFNEYCTTWGNPSAENIKKIIEAVKAFPVSTFIIDCGWYRPENGGWLNAIGDWQINRAMFPEGLRSVVKEINAAGMKAGIWYEYEISGRDSKIFYDESAHLRQNGEVITANNRRFLDLRKSKVQRYLSERVLKPLYENGFEYIKIDYNDAYGVGADGAESLGEGGRQVAEESIKFLDKIKDSVAGIVIENCSSGGSRIEPYRMSKVSMCSFSDAHECNEIPLVAANVSRVVPARQMQIWAVLRDGDTPQRTVYSLCAAFLGRICLSGDVVGMKKEKETLLLNGLNFYSHVKDIVRYGDIVSIDCNVESYRNPVGRQIYEKEYDGKKLVVLHALGADELINIPLNGYRLDCTFTDLNYAEEDGFLRVYAKAFSAGAFLLQKSNG